MSQQTINPAPPTRMTDSDFQVIGPLPFPGSDPTVALNLKG